MPSRRQVRQAAVQFLFARNASRGEEGERELWELIHDRERLLFDRARVKLLAHYQQGREATTTQLEKAILDVASAILAADPSEKLARAFQEIVSQEKKWAEGSSNLQRLTRADIGGWRRDLYQLLDRLSPLKQARQEITPKTEGFPPAMAKAIRDCFTKLDRYDERARMIQAPENFPEQRELKPLHRSQNEMAQLEKEALGITEQVEQSLDELDERINQHSENFDLKRLSKVDLAILRLATWEILKLPELDTAISINEAIDLARAFSGEESASFVNGVLDQIGKEQPI